MNRLRERLTARKEENGFTLIELIVVVVIIGILTAIAIPSYGAIQHTARQNMVNQTVTDLQKEIRSQIAVNGEYDSKIFSRYRTDEINVGLAVFGEDRTQLSAEWKSDPSISKKVIIDNLGY